VDEFEDAASLSEKTRREEQGNQLKNPPLFVKESKETVTERPSLEKNAVDSLGAAGSFS